MADKIEVYTASRDILRLKGDQECGMPVGQLNIVIHGIPGHQTVSFYCTKQKLHTDECAFIGRDLVVRRRHRD